MPFPTVKPMVRVIFWWSAVIVYAAFIYHVSAQSNPLPAIGISDTSGALITAVESPRFHFDKILHIIGYAFFGFLLYKACSTVMTKSSAATVGVIVFLLGSLYAVTDEYHQHFVPCRDASIQDGMADGVGVMIGIGVSLI